MSFAADVKAELCRAKLGKKCCTQAEACGVLLYCNRFSLREVKIVTESPAFAQRLPKLFRRAFLEQHRLRFSCHQLGEDGLFFVAFYRQNPGCLVVLEKPLYHYTAARRGSLSNSYHPERLEDNFYLSDAVWDTVAAWGLQDSPMHRAKASYCTIRDLMMGIKNLGCSPLSLSEQTAWLRSTLQKPRVRTAVRSTPLHAMQSRNDQVKLLLLKLQLCRAVLLLSGANQRKNT